MWQRMLGDLITLAMKDTLKDWRFNFNRPYVKDGIKWARNR